MNDTVAVRIIRDAAPGLITVYRFGSTVDGSEHARSDLDLAFLAAAPLDPVRRYELQEELAVALRRDVDLVDLRSASTVMRMQVLARGIRLAVFDPAEAERFETLVYSAYARLNEERRAILEQVAREGTVHGR